MDSDRVTNADNQRGSTMSTEHQSSSDKPIVIVGGGVTGLVTAHLLLERGQKQIVVEKLPTLGVWRAIQI